MEKYKIEKQIGLGNLAIVYKAHHINDPKHQLALKEVECQDINTAKSALDEVNSIADDKSKLFGSWHLGNFSFKYRIFHTITHRFICRLHDSCVNWDPKTNSAYVCYVMEYFPKGDLMTYLDNFRSKKLKIPLNVAKMWCAEMVEGINFLHQNNLIHRNIKPSSFYLRPAEHHHNQHESKEERFHLLVGDFGVLTVMKDARVKTRILNGAFNYVAPEVKGGQTFDIKSDVWSIGAVLLDIFTTSIYDQATFQGLLVKIRSDASVLEKILTDIEDVYERKSITKVLRGLLQIESGSRFSMKALINQDFLFEGLHMIDSELVRSTGLNDIPTVEPYPKEASFAANFDTIKKNLHNESTVQSVVAHMAHIIKDSDFNLAHTDYIKTLEKLMKMYSNNLTIQIGVLKIIRRGLMLNLHHALHKPHHEDIDEKKMVKLAVHLTPKLIERFYFVFLKHEKSLDLQIQAIKVIIQLANYEEQVTRLAEFNVIQQLIDVLENFHSNPVIASNACKAIWCLCTHEVIIKSMFQVKCLQHVRNALIHHLRNKHCVEMACNVVIAMCTNERLIAQEELNVDVTSAILVGLKHNLDSSHVVRSACMALTSLISFAEECAFRFLYMPPGQDNSNQEIDGVQLMKSTFIKHRDESEIVEHICCVFKELCTYDEMVVELKSLRLNETLINDISKRFRDNPEISQICSFIISKIESHKISPLVEKITNKKQQQEIF